MGPRVTQAEGVNNSLIFMAVLPLMLRGMRYAVLLIGLALALRRPENASATELYGTFAKLAGAEPVRRRIAGG